jgi:hypothetical protein
MITLEDLRMVSLPQETRSYTPVPHGTFVDIVKEHADKEGFRFMREDYKAARGGDLMSGKLIFIGDEPGINMQIGIANSYDKSRVAMVGLGAEVFICLNGCLSGEYEMRRKHTTNVWRDLEEMISGSIKMLHDNYRMIIHQKDILEQVECNKRAQAELLGRIFVEEEIVTPTMANIIRKEIIGSTKFPQDNAWSFYNHVTHALKESHPIEYIDRHVDFHQFMELNFK